MAPSKTETPEQVGDDDADGGVSSAQWTIAGGLVLSGLLGLFITGPVVDGSPPRVIVGVVSLGLLVLGLFLLYRFAETRAKTLTERERTALRREFRLRNRITSFDVLNGRGSERGFVVVRATWTTVPEHLATLYLYRSDRREVFDSAAAVQKSAGAPLFFKRRGEELEFVDEQVTERKAYHYYLWIQVHGSYRDHKEEKEVEVVRNIDFRSARIVAQFPETEEEYRKRVIRLSELRAKDDKAKPKTSTGGTNGPRPAESQSSDESPRLIDKIRAHVRALIAQSKEVEQILREIDTLLDQEGITDDADREVIKATVLSTFGIKQSGY